MQPLRPPSSVPKLTGYLGIVVFVLLFVFWPKDLMSGLSNVEQAVTFLLILFSSMAFYELVFAKTYRAPETGLDFSQSFNIQKIFTKDFAVKLFGLFISLALVGVFYSVPDMYREPWYLQFFVFVLSNALVISLLVLIYFSFVHIYMPKANDSYWHLGAFVLSRGKDGDKALIKDHFLALAVKAFFLPLMFCYFIGDWQYFINFKFSMDMDFKSFFNFLYGFLYFIDLAFVVVGYVFTARLFNAHIRWTESKAGGWVVCLLCYMPFWQIFGRNYLSYSSNMNWVTLTMDSAVLYTVWGSVILILTAIYLLSEAHFGLRFSNLTYRGLISHGMFRFTKHPAYISKNLSWWMLDVPFVAVDWTVALKNCVALLGVNGVYLMRAKYEEKCLEVAPEYQKYKDYIAQRGAFAIMKKLFFSFQTQKSQKS